MTENNVQNNLEWSVKEGLSEEMTFKLQSKGWARVRQIVENISGRWSCGCGASWKMVSGQSKKTWGRLIWDGARKAKDEEI